MELFKKVIITGPDDMTKEDGEYFCNRSGFRTVQKLLSNPPEESYMREIKWYLTPVRLEPRAFEWHNFETGHAYVDYIPHVGQDEKDGYTKIPLYTIKG